MIAAIYLRKSSPDERDAADGKSVAVQESLCRDLAAKRGLVVVDDLIFTDGDPDGLSGTIAMKYRPAGRRLLDAAGSKSFDVVLVAEDSRLTRNQDDDALSVLIRQCKVRVIYAQSDHEVKFKTSTDRFLTKVNSYVAESYAEFISGKVADKNRDTNKRGHADGRKVYGYTTIEVGGHREYRINDEQAAIVKRVFQLAAEGFGDRRISDLLTKESVPAPARAKGWAKGIIREMLLQELYIGTLVYDKSHCIGKKEHRADDGTVSMVNDVVRITDPTKWKRTPKPELRIISDALWQKVQDRKAKTKAAYIRTPDGQLQSKPETALTAQHILNGFLRCGVCGSSMTFQAKRATIRRYYCIAHQNRGKATCPNGRGIPEKPLDDLVKAKLLEVLADEDIIQELIDESAARYARDHAAKSDERANLEAEESRLAAIVDRYHEAFEAGKPLDYTRLKERTAELEAVRVKLAEPATVKVDKVAVVEGLRRAGLMFATEPAGVRAAFRKLGVDRITASPNPDGSWKIQGPNLVAIISHQVTHRQARGV